MPRLPRILVVDLLRVVAAVQMVQGHTIDALLAASARSGPGFELWSKLRGLTAVAFLFSAGMAFQLSTLRDLGSHLQRPGLVRRRFARAGRLIALGYLLHLPWAFLSQASPPEREASLRALMAVDVLQCIGVTLAVIEALAWRLRDAHKTELACGLLGVCALGLGPLSGSLEAGGPLRALLDYFTPTGGSLFPLAPWAGHMLLGVALCRPLLGGGARSFRLAVAALGFLLLWRGLEGLHAPYVLRDHAGRLFGVVLALAVLGRLEWAAKSFSGFVLAASSETLVIYVSHVVLVYGSAFSLATQVGPSLSPLAATAAAAAMIAFSFACALAYARASAGLAARTATG